MRVTPAARRDRPHRPLSRAAVLPRVAWDAAHLLSLATLPEDASAPVRHPLVGRRERGVERLAAVTRRALPLVPAPLRFVPHARRAERRVRRAERQLGA